MVSSAASTVADYLASLPPDRCAAITRVREIVNARLPRGYEETMQYGMISWIVPRSRLAETYNGQAIALASLASQKQYMALYLGRLQAQRVVQGCLPGHRQEARHGQGLRPVQDARRAPTRRHRRGGLQVPVDAYVAIYEASRATTVKPKAVAARSRPVAAARPTTTARPVAAARPTTTARPTATTKTKPAAAAKPAASRAAKPTARSASRRAKPAARPAKPTRASRRR